MKNNSLEIEFRTRFKELSQRIVRKPGSFTPEWAASPNESFSHYTRTSTINYLAACNELMMESDWPFPGYVDLRRYFEIFSRCAKSTFPPFGILLKSTIGLLPRGDLWRWFGLCLTSRLRVGNNADTSMIFLFHIYIKQIEKFWLSKPIIQERKEIVREIFHAYNEGLWTPATSATFTLIDHVTRDICDAKDLRIMMNMLKNSFYKKAGLSPGQITPGFSANPQLENSPDADVLFRKVEEDLRLPGIYLASFFHFTDKFYGWHSGDDLVSDSPGVNRHSIMHGACEKVSSETATKVLLFLDLILRLEEILRFLVKGSALPTNLCKNELK